MLKSQRYFAGPVEAIILDWAGTTIDFGSLAPVYAFMELFQTEGITVTQAEAREPMGTEKRVHICRMLANPRIAQAWLDVKGNEPTDAEIDRLYHDFAPIQTRIVGERSQLIPGWKGALDVLLEQGIKIGSNTGYGPGMMQPALVAAKEQGYEPASCVFATDVERGRPYPDMALAVAMELQASHVQGCIKVDDTIPGIEEGLRAGMWTVAVSVSGNEVGLDRGDWQSLPVTEQQQRRLDAEQRLYAAGAHYVIDSVAELPAIVDEISARLSAGDKP
ncbi:MAG: phosphonoacetaldehyde hydrolase [Saccharospirillaceae bacterium]|jgi:phosphonoacetaldehyde hydrolase|nr:phosphonoacetaldehyde hydrolase [Saccharospirillaceae bacterium]